MPTALSTLLPLINIPRCPHTRQVHALRNAARKFCRDTEVWRENIPEFDTVPDQADYVLDPGAGNAFIRVYIVKRDGMGLSECLWAMSGDNTLILKPAPKAVHKIVATAVLMPHILTSTLPDVLVGRWGEYIIAGAMFELKADKGSEADPLPWFDPSGAVIARERYYEGVGAAKMEVFSRMQSGLSHIITFGGTR
jgi:hypothetical protein